MVGVKVIFYCGTTNEPPSHLRGQKRDFSVQQQKKRIGKALRSAASNIAEGVQNPPQSMRKSSSLCRGEDGFSGLVVSMLASGTQVCGFRPGRSRWIFTGVKILSIPSSGGEVKESVPCSSFAACKRT